MQEVMKKQQYIQPKSFLEVISAQATVMLLGSPTGPEPSSDSGSGAPGRGIGTIEGE